MHHTVVPLDPNDESTSIGTAPAINVIHDLLHPEAGPFTAYLHPDPVDDMFASDFDFFELTIHTKGLEYIFTFSADLFVVADVPGEHVGTTGTVDIVYPEVGFTFITVYEQVILESGQVAYVEVTEGYQVADEVTNAFSADLIASITTSAEVMFRAEDEREGYVPYLEAYTFDGGQANLLSSDEVQGTAQFTGRYFVLVETSDFALATTIVPMTGEDFHPNGRYLIMEGSQVQESELDSVQFDEWGPNWIQRVPYDGSTTPPPPPGPPVVFVIGPSSAEGDPGSASELVFEIRLSAPSTSTVTVGYSTGFGGTAVVGEDFQSAEGTVTFAPGETVQYVSVNVIPDTSDEDDETVELVLENPVNATLGASTGVGTITDDDGSDPYPSPFPEGTGLEPTQPVTAETGRWSTSPAEYDATTGLYSSNGIVFDDFAVGREGIVVPSAQAIVGAVYRFIIQSTDPQVAGYLNGWFSSAERGAAVGDHFEDQFDTGFAIADAIATDNTSFDVDAALQQVETRYNQFLVDMGTSIGVDFGIRWGTQNSAISTILDIDARDQPAPILASAGHHDVWFGGSGADTIYLGDLNDAAWGGWGNDRLFGETGNDALHGSRGDDVIDGGAGSDSLAGGDGLDVLIGGTGSDRLAGGAGNDVFRGTAAELNGDVIGDFGAGDRIVISNATLASFSHSLSGSTLTFSGGTLSIAGGVAGTLVASAAAEGGVQLTLGTTPPPPPPPSMSRAKLLLTEGGQDFIVGGNVAVLGTTAGGEVIEIVRGDVSLDASFNAGGDTVVLPGNASSYTAVLAGSFVTLEGDGVRVAIPVGLVGLSVQFANSTRTLQIADGQVMLGTQQITTTEQAVAAFGRPLDDVAETGPDSLGRLILTAPGQDVDIGGNVSVTGTSAPGEVITVLGGTIRLDASFNAGGDTVVLANDASDYTATLSGSFVTIADGDTNVAIPVGLAGLMVDFDDGSALLRYDTASGEVRLGDDVVTHAAAEAQSYRLAFDDGFSFA